MIITTTPGPPPEGEPQTFVRWVHLWTGYYHISHALVEVAGQYYLERAGQWHRAAETLTLEAFPYAVG